MFHYHRVWGFGVLGFRVSVPWDSILFIHFPLFIVYLPDKFKSISHWKEDLRNLASSTGEAPHGLLKKLRRPPKEARWRLKRTFPNVYGPKPAGITGFPTEQRVQPNKWFFYFQVVLDHTKAEGNGSPAK